MNNKGFAISGIMYAILLVFLLLLLGILGMLGSRKIILDKTKSDIKKKLEGETSNVVYDFTYTGNYQEFVVPEGGIYKIELWGASGGNAENQINGGLGGYTKGEIELKKDEILYVYVGGVGESGNMGNFATKQSFNGGGEGHGLNNTGSAVTAGGGATDIRLVSGEWNNFESLKSRIMVASAGGGGLYWDKTGYTNGGSAGGLIGYDGKLMYTAKDPDDRVLKDNTGGTQTSGGITNTGDLNASENGLFGIGGTARIASSAVVSSGGGGGYYGGSAGKDQSYSPSSGAGGSSFISGHNGCDAIDISSTEDNIVHTGASNHYSGYVFKNTLMIDGLGYRWSNVKEEYMGVTLPDGSKDIGNSGSGYARITKID